MRSTTFPISENGNSIFPVAQFKNLGVFLGLSLSLTPHIWLNPRPHYEEPPFKPCNHFSLSPLLPPRSRPPWFLSWIMAVVSQQIFMLPPLLFCHLVAYYFSATTHFPIPCFAMLGPRLYKSHFSFASWFPVRLSNSTSEALDEGWRRKRGLCSSCWHSVGFLSPCGSWEDGFSSSSFP